VIAASRGAPGGSAWVFGRLARREQGPPEAGSPVTKQIEE